MNDSNITPLVERRRFLQALGLGSVAAAAGVVGYAQVTKSDPKAAAATVSGGSSDGLTSSAPSTTAPPVATPSGQRTLVVLELNGGNDALNTLVPEHGRYRDGRPSLALPEGDLLELAGLSTHGLHPSLAPLASIWNAGNLGIVAGVGFDGASRSHFQAMDWWSAGSAGSTQAGWLGRWRDAAHPDEANPLHAVSLGGRSRSLRAFTGTATVVESPPDFALRVPRGGDADRIDAALTAISVGAASESANWLDAAHVAGADARDAAERFAGLVDAAGSVPSNRRSQSVTELMKTASQLIQADLGTRVIVVSTRGFDTHANQLTTHAALLSDVATGVGALLTEVEAAGRGDDVLVMTTSEFGRRVDENGSGGTDHGRAGVQFLAGKSIAGRLVGHHDLDHLTNGDLTPSIDVRSLYGTALDWLGGPTTDVLGRAFDDLGLLSA